jgi:hypothetical protein
MKMNETFLILKQRKKVISNDLQLVKKQSHLESLSIFFSMHKEKLTY